MKQEVWYLYILLCKGNTLYTGITNNVENRIQKHFAGIAAKYTKAHPPLLQVYQERLANKSAAAKREREIKKWSRSKKINDLRLTLVDCVVQDKLPTVE